MYIDFSSALQARQAELYIKAKMYDQLNEYNRKCCVIKMTAPFVGIASFLITVSSAILHVAECIFKGFTNLFLGACVKDLSVLKGIKQICLETPLSLLLLLAKTLRYVAGFFFITALMIFKTDPFTASRHTDNVEHYEKITAQINLDKEKHDGKITI